MDREELKFQDGNLFSQHFIKKRIQEYTEWKELDVEEKFDEAREIFLENKDVLEDSEADTQSKFIDRIFEDVLGHYFTEQQIKPIASTNIKDAKPDYIFLKDRSQHKELNPDEYFDKSYIVADAKKWKRNLDSSQTGRDNPSSQIYEYVNNTRIPWGILTNGVKWRLYSYEELGRDIYYEIDLLKILSQPKDEQALRDFKYFYLFFRRDSFIPRSQGFIDHLLQDSNLFEKELQENLEDRVYSALRFTAQGFLSREENELTVEENREEVYENSLIFIYRILFILYAEDRGLLPIFQDGYRQKFSLLHLKTAINEGNIEGIFSPDDWVWDDRIEDLFVALKEGPTLQNFDGEEYSITAYNGRLFDNEEYPFLADNKINGDYLLKILRNLVVSKDERGNEVLVDYRDLDIKDLGSVYEGLLEHELRPAKEKLILEDGDWKEISSVSKDWDSTAESEKVSEGEVYIANESGQRKATGSYYTPDGVVSHLVSKTVSRKVNEKVEGVESEDQKLSRILSINICDPAMGSGHFLTEATEVLAKKLVDNIDFSKSSYDPEHEKKWAKRQVVKNCIYGVDLNSLATELAKVSLWIETMSKDRPLNFLDHHLKVGDSLRGIKTLDSVFTHPDETVQKGLDYEFGSPDKIKEDLRAQYQHIDDLDENSVEDIRKKEAAYQKFKDENKMYNHFKQLSNAYIGHYFGIDVPKAEYENMLNSISTSVFEDYSNQDWFVKSQDEAKQNQYFHWDLEFPQVFLGENSGFDIVIGNPPWVSFGLRDTQKLSENEKKYFKSEYKTAQYKIATYPLFMEKGINLCNQEGYHGYIVPDSFLLGMYFSNTRKMLLENTNLLEITLILEDFWKDAEIGQSTVYLTKMSPNEEIEIGLSDTLKDFSERSYKTNKVTAEYFKNQYRNQFRLIVNKKDREIISSIEQENDLRLGDEEVGEFYSGCIGKYGKGSIVSTEKKESHSIENRSGDKVIDDSQAKDRWKKLLVSGSNIARFGVKWSGDYIYVHEDEEIRQKYAKSGFDVEKYKGKKVFVRQTGDNIVAAYDNKEYFCLNNMHVLNVKKFSGLQVTGILNSKLLRYYYETISLEKGRSMAQTDIDDLENLPIPNKENEELEELAAEVKNLKETVMSLNLDIRSYISEDFSGKTLGELYTCPSDGLPNSIFRDTKKDKDMLKVSDIRISENENILVLEVSAKYKKDGEDDYVETEYKPLFEFHNPSEKEKIVIKEVIPEIVRNSGGYANFYDYTTQTISLSERFKEIELPDLNDQEENLKKYKEVKDRADEVRDDIKIKKDKMDAIVFKLYDLDKSQASRVLKTIKTDSNRKNRILNEL